MKLRRLRRLEEDCEPDLKLHMLDVLNKMRSSRVKTSLILSLMNCCHKYKEVRELMRLWFAEVNYTKRRKYLRHLKEWVNE